MKKKTEPKMHTYRVDQTIYFKPGIKNHPEFNLEHNQTIIVKYNSHREALDALIGDLIKIHGAFIEIKSGYHLNCQSQGIRIFTGLSIENKPDWDTSAEPRVVCNSYMNIVMAEVLDGGYRTPASSFPEAVLDFYDIKGVKVNECRIKELNDLRRTAYDPKAKGDTEARVQHEYFAALPVEQRPRHKCLFDPD